LGDRAAWPIESGVLPVAPAGQLKPAVVCVRPDGLAIACLLLVRVGFGAEFDAGAAWP
jgi:hypothetical protein